MHLRRAFRVLSALAAAILGVAPVFAQEVDDVGIRSGKYKMTQYRETGESVPRKGPVIEVYSSSGIDYDTIANDNEGLWFTLGVKGRCAGDQRVGKAELMLPQGGESLSVKKNRKTFARKFKTITARSGFLMPGIGRTPVQACMKELDRRVAVSNLSREEWIERGFVVRYEDAYTLGFALTCNQGKGWNQFGKAETTAPVWIACQPSRVAAAGSRQAATADTLAAGAPTRLLTPRPDQPESAEPAKIATLTKPAERGPLISGLVLSTDKKDYQGRCPVALRFSGAVTVSRAGTVRYRLIDDEGNASPIRSLKFAAAGSQSIIGWSKAFALPAATGMTEGPVEGAGAEEGADYEGWMRIEIVGPADAQPSGKADYRVNCE